MMRFCAELIDAAAEQTELDAELDQQAQVVIRDGLECGNRIGNAAGAAVRDGKREQAEAFVSEDLTALEHSLAILRTGSGCVQREFAFGKESKNALSNRQPISGQRIVNECW